MKTLTTQADDARARRYAEPVYLLTLTLYRDQFGPTPVAATFYLSDAVRTELGQTWLPLVQSWGTVGDAIDQLGPGGAIGALDVVLFNSFPIDTPTVSATRFSDMVRAGLNGGANTFDIAFGEATLTVLFKGGTSGDQVALFGLRCEEVTDLTEATCVLRMTGRGLALEDAEDLYRVSTADFPICDPDAVGMPIPLAIGQVVDAPGIGLVSGLVHVLAADLPATPVGSVPVSNADLVARMPATGTLQIDQEQMTYTGRNIPGMSFTGITRGAFGTGLLAHTKGAPVFQVLSEYVYAFAANPGPAHTVLNVPRLRSDGALLAAGSYTIELTNTTLKADRRLVVARFPVRPIITKQVVLEIEDTIEVQDGITVPDPSYVEDSIDVADTIGSYTPASEYLKQFSITPLPITLRGAAENNSNPQWKYTNVYVDLNDLPFGGTVRECHYSIGLEVFGGDLGRYFDTFHSTGWEIYGQVQIYSTGQWVRVFQQDLLRDAGGNYYPVLVYSGAPTFTFGLTAYTRYLQLSLGIRQTPRTEPGGGSGPGGVTRPPYISFSLITVDVRRDFPIIKTGGADKVGTAKKIGKAEKVGTAIKVGTVQLVGNTSAETVLGTITADVDGLCDSPAGTITALTGGPGANQLLLNPVDITYLLMREVFGETDPARYRAATWAEARSLLNLSNYRWDFLYRGGTWSEFRRLVGFQSRSDLFLEGGQYALVYRQLRPVSHTFDARNTDGEPTFGWTPRTELVTTLTATYDLHPGTGTAQASLERRSTRQTTRYGSRRRIDRRIGGRDLPLPWVRSGVLADALANYWLGEWEIPRMTATVRGYWDALPLEKTDIVTVDAPLVNVFGTLGFAVRSKRYRIASGLVEFELVELDQLPSEHTLPARYYIVGVYTWALAAQYRLLATLDLTHAAAYRLVVPGLPRDVPGLYYLTVTRTLDRAATYALQAQLELELAAGYAIIARYDSALTYDDAVMFYDGAADPSPRFDDSGIYDTGLEYDLILGAA